jgi:hypothetical protein
LSLITISRYWLKTCLISERPINPFYFLSNNVNISIASSSLPWPSNHFFWIISNTYERENESLLACEAVISSYIYLPFIFVNPKFPKILLSCLRLIAPVFSES